MEPWVAVLLTLTSVFLLVAELVLVIMLVGVFNKIRSLDQVYRSLLDVHSRSYAMYTTLLRTLLRYELHMARWYSNSTGLPWAFDPLLAAESAKIEAEIRKLTEDQVKKET